MRLERFYADTPLPGPGMQVRLEGPEAQHLLRVMRKKTGDRVTLFDGTGTEVRAQILDCDKRSAVFEVLEGVAAGTGTGRTLELAVALPRGGEAADLVRRVIEAGADGITPLIGRRSVQRPDHKRAGKLRERFRQAAIAAMKQSGRNVMPHFSEPVRIEDLVLPQGARGVFGSTAGGASLRAWEKDAGGVPSHLVVVVGPEGGLAPEEESSLRGAGFDAVSLGESVLRVETAAVALVSWFASATSEEGGAS